MSKLSFIDARHLLTRTGFGAEWQQVKRFESMPLHKAIDTLLTQRHHPRPPHTLMDWRRMQLLQQDKRRTRQLMHTTKNEGTRLQSWWLQHLLETKSPLLERMTLFWHDHFPSSIDKTRAGHFLLKQNQLLRQHALGRYDVLLQAIAKDPAMLLYLDGHQNTKEALNENFARELLELFTLRRGYSERDVREAARAFTGWSINSQGHVFLDRQKHDDGRKVFLGQVGNFNGDDIIRILLRDPRTAETIAEKLWRVFVSVEQPNPHWVRQWANVYRQSDYNTAVLVKTILLSRPFWEQRNHGNLIKSPIDLAVGTLRTLPYRLPRNDLPHQLNLLGQGVFKHPSVKGWPQGKEWISTASWLQRNALLTNLTRGNLNPRRRRGNVSGQLPQAANPELRNWLHATTSVKNISDNMDVQRYIRELVLDPAYQVT